MESLVAVFFEYILGGVGSLFLWMFYFKWKGKTLKQVFQQHGVLSVALTISLIGAVSVILMK